jgi:hypothetical protein
MRRRFPGVPTTARAAGVPADPGSYARRGISGAGVGIPWPVLLPGSSAEPAGSVKGADAVGRADADEMPAVDDPRERLARTCGCALSRAEAGVWQGGTPIARLVHCGSRTGDVRAPAPVPRRDFYVEGLGMQARLIGMATTAWCSSPLAVWLLEPRELTVRRPRVRGDRRRLTGERDPCPSRGTRLGWTD